jgi:hypothetical protein
VVFARRINVTKEYLVSIYGKTEENVCSKVVGVIL